MVRQSKENLPADKFAETFNKFIETSQKPYTPSTYYKPSGVGGCIRKMYFERTGQALQDNASYNLIAMGESGTYRHEAIQEYMVKLSSQGDTSLKWLDVAEYLEAHPVEGTEVDKNFVKNDYETKCKQDLLQLSFLCDGLVEWEGKTYVFEIKTESMFKYSKHEEPWEAHKYQATCYALSLGVDDVLFLYENRDTFDKKAYIFHVTDEWKDKVVDKLNQCEDAVEEGVSPKVYCGSSYCPYCKGEGKKL